MFIQMNLNEKSLGNVFVCGEIESESTFKGKIKDLNPVVMRLMQNLLRFL